MRFLWIGFSVCVLGAGVASWASDFAEARRQAAREEGAALERLHRSICTDAVARRAGRLLDTLDGDDVFVQAAHWRAMSPALREDFATWASVCRREATPISIRLAADGETVATYSRRAGYEDVY